MICRRCFHFRSQLCGAGVRQLIGMDAQFESMLFRRRQNLSRLRDIEIAALTKHITKFSQFFRRHARQHFLDYKINIFRLPPFARNRVSTQKCGHKLNWRFLIQPPNHAQNLQLIFNRKPVARFRFDGGRSAFQKPIRVCFGLLEKLGLVCRACLLDS